jgi:hypothetical protein
MGRETCAVFLLGSEPPGVDNPGVAMLTTLPIARLSGTHAARPAASLAVGARFFETDTLDVFFSTGVTWIQTGVCSRVEANGFSSGNLSARPAAATCLGCLYQDENGVIYEAFPGGWATVTLAETPNQGLPAPSVVVTNAGPPDGNATITIQALDALGNNLTRRCLLRVWLSATAYGAPTDLGTLTATTGILLKEDTDDALATVATDATGKAVLVLDTAADGNVHAMASIVGVLATGNAAITGNA